MLRSDDVDVRLIVSPVPEPRLMVAEPVRIALSWAPVRVIESVPEVPVRLPVSMLLIVGKRKLRDVAARHDVQRVRAAADQIDGPEAGQLRCRHRHGVAAGAAGQGLDVRHRATGEVHGRAVGKNDGVAVGTALDRLARGEVAVGQVDRVVAAARRDRVGALAACDGIGDSCCR